METDLTNFDPDYEFDPDSFFNNVIKIMSIKYFNRIKQFIIRLYRNNLFLGHTLGKTPSRTICYACDKHRESRVELMFNCSITNRILQFMIRILRKVGCLRDGCKIDMFLFYRYPINSIENVTLMFTWKFIYNNKFIDQPLNERTYLRAYKGLIAIIVHMSIPMSLWAMNVEKILIEELS